ncbi:MAG: transposase [Betaproteobacteria bacterium]|nr:transposase [Betaproteobacteria bacterium]
MTEKHTELSQRLVIGHKRDGRSCYDKEAKRELVEACLRPGVSVARLALQHGVNANLLRTWITRYERQRPVMVGRPATGMAAVTVESAFIPVVAAKVPVQSRPLQFGAQLPNGIKLDLSAVSSDDLSVVLRLLCELPCSGSTPG